MVINLIFLMIPVFLTVYLYLKYGAETAIEKSVIPFMILIPFSFREYISPYAPLLTFYCCAILPLLIIGLIVYKVPRNFSLMDLLVLSFVLMCTYAGFESSGSQFGKSIIMYEAMETLIPYFVIRCFIEKRNVIRFLTTLTIFISITAIFAPVEFFINRTLANIYQIFWQKNGLWAPFVRNGFNRVYSMYGHPIHAGIIFSTSVILLIVLYKLRVYRNKKLITALILINVMALIMTISRSSYIMIIPSIMVFWYSLVGHKKTYAVILVVMFTVGYTVGMDMYNSYIEIKPGEKASETKQSAYYRKQLLDNYTEIAKKRPFYGYGNNIPVLGGQYSIDNHYLLLSLRYGYIATGIFILMHLMALIKAIIISREYTKNFKIFCFMKNFFVSLPRKQWRFLCDDI